MTLVKSALLAAAATLAIGSAAQAADAIGIPAPVVPVAPIASSAYDWSGFYAGVRVGAQNEVDFDTDWLVGAEIGANAAFGMFVLGAELAVDAIFEDAETYAYGEVTARAGVAFDQFLVYGTVGYGTDFDATVGSGDHVLAGGGAEIAFTDSVSLDARYVYGWDQSNDANSSDIHKFTIGANFHF